MAIHPIIIQMVYYAVTMILTILLIGLLQKGFFFAFLRVKLSFGALVLVKARAINRDYFSVGMVEEGFLLYNSVAGVKRLSVDDSACFYRVLGTNWIDVDDIKNAICKIDYSIVSGFDSIKHTALYVRALYKPNLNNKVTKIIIGCLILLIFLVIATAFFVYKQNYSLEFINSQMAGVVEAVRELKAINAVI